MSIFSKHKIAWSLLLLILLAAGLVFLQGHFAACGRWVGRREWDFYQSMFRAQVSSAFCQQYGMEMDTPEDWNKPCEGTTAQKALDEQTALAIRRDDRLRQLSKEYQVQQLPSFAAMLRRMKQVNQDRSANKQQGQPVYGTLQYDCSTYYSTLKSECETQVIGAMMDHALKDPVLLRQVYEQMQPEQFPRTICAELVLYHVDPDGRCEQPHLTRQAAAELRAKVEETGAVSQQQADSLTGFPVLIWEQTLDSSKISREESQHAELLFAAQTAGEGRCFVLEEGSSAFWYVKKLSGTEKPPLETNQVTVAAWHANNEYDRIMQTA